MDQGMIIVLKHQFWKWLVGRVLQLIRFNHGVKNLSNFRLSVLNVMLLLTVFWDMTGAAVINNCFAKFGFLEMLNEEV
jgi:hypothetical protein